METSNNLYLTDNNLSGIVHPGEILKEELRERKIQQKDFAAKMGMPPSHLSALIHGKRNITATIAQRIEEALEIPAYIWMNLQSQYNLDLKKREMAQANKPYTYSYHHPLAPITALCEPEPVYGSGSIRKTVQLPLDDLAHISCGTETIFQETLGIHILNSSHIGKQKLQVGSSNSFYCFCVSGICSLRNLHDFVYDRSVAGIVAKEVEDGAEIL